jgi:hypothetical protein
MAFNQSSGLVNLPNFMEGMYRVLLIYSTGFAPEVAFMSQLYSPIALASTCQFGPGTMTVLWYKACKSLVEAAVREYFISSQVVMALEGCCSVLHFV